MIGGDDDSGGFEVGEEFGGLGWLKVSWVGKNKGSTTRMGKICWTESTSWREEGKKDVSSKRVTFPDT